MGYAVRYVSAAGVENAITENTCFCTGVGRIIRGTAETVFFKQTHDLTNVDYLNVTVLGKHITNAGTIKIYFDTTLKLTLSINQTAEYPFHDRIDCTGVTGNQIIKATIYNSAPGGDTVCHNLTICNEEA